MGSRLHIFETKLGWVGIAGFGGLISHLVLPESSREKAASAILETSGGYAVEVRDDFSGECGRITDYFAGCHVDFACELDISTHTQFCREVWNVVREIPYGETRTYLWVAERTCGPGGARAVGQALGANPVPVIIPCHRIVQSDGALGGFSAGNAWKRMLLDMEQAPEVVQE